MLTKIAWKNIWRNRVRSVILIIAIALGIWALIFINGVSTGMVKGYVENAIQNRTSHLQVHSPAFVDEKEIGHFFNSSRIDTFLQQKKFIEDYSQRIIVNGMISSPQSSRGIILYGVNPETENTVTRLNDKIAEGDSLQMVQGNYILIGREMADKLGVKVKSKVVINFQNIQGELTSAAFRIAGVMKNTASLTGENKAYTNLNVLRDLTGMQQDQVHEIAILVRNLENLNQNQQVLKAKFPRLSIKDYKEIAPDVALMGSQITISLSIMIVIFMLALVFGIINTMLMAVLERYKELGMLLAVGMKKIQVFLMIVLETIFLSMVGVPVGMALGVLTIRITHHYGINLENWANSLQEFGLISTIYPELDIAHYFIVGGAVLLTAILASLYPARKATSLNPIQALRKI